MIIKYSDGKIGKVVKTDEYEEDMNEKLKEAYEKEEDDKLKKEGAANVPFWAENN